MKIERINEGCVKIDGIVHQGDTIYGDPHIEKGFYIHIEGEPSHQPVTFYTFDEMFEVLNAYVIAIRLGYRLSFRTFEKYGYLRSISK